MVNPYEKIEIQPKDNIPSLEPNRKESESVADSDTKTGKIIDGKLDLVSNELLEFNKRILDLTEKYNKSFEKLAGVLEDPAEAGLHIE